MDSISVVCITSDLNSYSLVSCLCHPYLQGIVFLLHKKRLCLVLLRLYSGLTKLLDPKANSRLPGRWRTGYSAIYVIYAKIGC